MQESMDLKQLLEEVIRQDQPVTVDAPLGLPLSHSGIRHNIKPKRDFTTNTAQNARMVLHFSDVRAPTLLMVLLKDGATELERFEITSNAHRQISAKLQIPWKYYQRLMCDHADMICDQVNALFEREPSSRLFRVLDGKVRAFLSDRYLRLDNKEILTDILPVITQGQSDGTLRVMSNSCTDNDMHMKVIFLSDELSHEITSVRGTPRIIRPGFKLSNSETGCGSLRMDGFFYDDYCTNGCVFGVENAFKLQRRHLGGRLIEGEFFEVISDETRALEDKAIISAVNDGLNALSNPDTVAEMAERLREAAHSETAVQPVAAVNMIVKELDLNEGETDGILQTFLRDLDFTQFGMASAVTELANSKQVPYDRACRLEEIGGDILSLTQSAWKHYASADNRTLQTIDA